MGRWCKDSCKRRRTGAYVTIETENRTEAGQPSKLVVVGSTPIARCVTALVTS